MYLSLKHNSPNYFKQLATFFASCSLSEINIGILCLNTLAAVGFSSHPSITKGYDSQTRGLFTEFLSRSVRMAPAANSDFQLGLCHFLPVHKHRRKE